MKVEAFRGLIGNVIYEALALIARRQPLMAQMQMATPSSPGDVIVY